MWLLHGLLLLVLSFLYIYTHLNAVSINSPGRIFLAYGGSWGTIHTALHDVGLKFTFGSIVAKTQQLLGTRRTFS